MGAALSVSSADVVNKATIDTFQIASNSCPATCVNLISGVDIILNNTTTGNITFDQKCTADASCSMTNAVDNTTTAIQLAQAKAESIAPLLPIGIQINISKSSTTNDIKTALTQELNNVCTANVNNTLQNVLVYATNSKTGDIGFVQSGNAHAFCVMQNNAKIQLSLQQKGEATATSGNSLGGIFGAIMAIVIIVLIIGVIAKASKKNQQGGNQGNNNNNNQGNNNQGNNSMYQQGAQQYGGGGKRGK